jgi:hypothetical protein
LQAHQQRLKAADNQKEECGDKIPDTKFFMVDSGEPAIKAF